MDPEKKSTFMKFGTLTAILLALIIVIIVLKVDIGDDQHYGFWELSNDEIPLVVIKSVSITEAESAISLENKGERWIITNPVSERNAKDSAKKFYDFLRDCIFQTIITNKETSWSEFDVADENSMLISISYTIQEDAATVSDDTSANETNYVRVNNVVPDPQAEVNIITFYLGKQARGSGDFFIRFKDESDVYRVSYDPEIGLPGIPDYFQTDLNYWMKKEIVQNLASSDIDRIEYYGEDESRIYNLEADEWKLFLEQEAQPEEITVKLESMTDILQQFINLTFQSLVYDEYLISSKYSLDKEPVATIKYSLSDYTTMQEIQIFSTARQEEPLVESDDEADLDEDIPGDEPEPQSEDDEDDEYYISLNQDFPAIMLVNITSIDNVFTKPVDDIMKTDEPESPELPDDFNFEDLNLEMPEIQE